jgi:hypothetical protein
MKEKEGGQGTIVNEKEEKMLRLVASLIVQIVLNKSYERDRLCQDQQEGSVGVLPAGPGSQDKGVLHKE